MWFNLLASLQKPITRVGPNDDYELDPIYFNKQYVTRFNIRTVFEYAGSLFLISSDSDLIWRSFDDGVTWDRVYVDPIYGRLVTHEILDDRLVLVYKTTVLYTMKNAFNNTQLQQWIPTPSINIQNSWDPGLNGVSYRQGTWFVLMENGVVYTGTSLSTMEQTTSIPFTDPNTFSSIPTLLNTHNHTYVFGSAGNYAYTNNNVDWTVSILPRQYFFGINAIRYNKQYNIIMLSHPDGVLHTVAGSPTWEFCDIAYSYPDAHEPQDMYWFDGKLITSHLQGHKLITCINNSPVFVHDLYTQYMVPMTNFVEVNNQTLGHNLYAVMANGITYKFNMGSNWTKTSELGANLFFQSPTNSMRQEIWTVDEYTHEDVNVNQWVIEETGDLWSINGNVTYKGRVGFFGNYGTLIFPYDEWYSTMASYDFLNNINSGLYSFVNSGTNLVILGTNNNQYYSYSNAQSYWRYFNITPSSPIDLQYDVVDITDANGVAWGISRTRDQESYMVEFLPGNTIIFKSMGNTFGAPYIEVLQTMPSFTGTCITANDTNIIIGGTDGQLVFTTDSGISWNTSNTFTSQTISKVVYDDGTWHAFTSDSIYTSTNLSDWVFSHSASSDHHQWRRVNVFNGVWYSALGAVGWGSEFKVSYDKGASWGELPGVYPDAGVNRNLFGASVANGILFICIDSPFSYRYDMISTSDLLNFNRSWLKQYNGRKSEVWVHYIPQDGTYHAVSHDDNRETYHSRFIGSSKSTDGLTWLFELGTGAENTGEGPR